MMKHKAFLQKSRRRLHHQQGVVLYVALIVMIAMMLAGVAMLRSVGTGVGVAGNLAFKQNATLAGDRAAEAAISWLQSLPAATAAVTLQNDDTAHGYFSSWDTTFNPTGTQSVPTPFDWSSAAVQVATNDDGAGNKVRYVIHRLCKVANASAQDGGGQECAVYSSGGGSGSIVANVGGGPFSAGAGSPTLFRVTSRVDGPRNTLSYVQILVY